MFLNGSSVAHGLVKSNTGWCDWVPPGWLRSLRLAAAFWRSLLTVTPSADLHHIAEHFELFPADQTASQNNRQEDRQSLPEASSALSKCFSQYPDLSLLVSVWGRHIKCASSFFTFKLCDSDILVDWLLIIFSPINLIDKFEDPYYAGIICYGYTPSGQQNCDKQQWVTVHHIFLRRCFPPVSIQLRPQNWHTEAAERR